MTKTIKVLAILFISLLFITNISLATDINMNLQPEDSNVSNELEETTNDTIDEAKAIAQLHPDIINPEPSELIGGTNGGVSDMGFVKEVIKEIRKIDSDILIEQAAGITNGEQVYDFIIAGSEAAGAASGIMNAEDPIAMIDEMIAATRRAADDLKKRG